MVILLPLGTCGLAAAPRLTLPARLDRDVSFWVRVYTQIGSDAGFLYDKYHLRVIYATLCFAPDSSPLQRQQHIEHAVERLKAELRQIASGQGPLTRAEEHIKALWGSGATRRTLLRAAHDIRFQLGQLNRFKAALIRSGAWHAYIVRTLAEFGLPRGLAALPLIESAYNPLAYSSAGAAGLWQFMPMTGRRFMTIDRTVDDRFDPYRETKAAAELLAEDYRLLGTWPLAITAYHQGVAAVRLAVRTMGTTHIAAIVRHYRSPDFGFAGRNFYVSFLAAREIERDPRRFFGKLTPRKEERVREVSLTERTPVQALERVLNIDPERLRRLNPALRPAVWTGSADVPEGYRLRLPSADTGWTSAALAASLGAQALFASQAVPADNRLRAAQAFSAIGRLYRTSARSDALQPALITGDTGLQAGGPGGKWAGSGGTQIVTFDTGAGVAAAAPEEAVRLPYHMHVDRRYGSEHAYPDRGSVVRHLPKGATAVYYAGISYWFAGGVWYERWPSTPVYIVVAPPIGVVVRSLPAFVRRVSYRGVTFLYANDVFYRPRPALGGFQVVNDPVDTSAAGLSAAGGPRSRAVAPVLPARMRRSAVMRASAKTQPPVMVRPLSHALMPIRVSAPIQTLTPITPQAPVETGTPLAAKAARAPPPIPGAKSGTASTLLSPQRFALQALDGQSAGQQARDRYACDRFAVARSGFDPLARESGAPAADLARQTSEYERALVACLSGRGYIVTVR